MDTLMTPRDAPSPLMLADRLLTMAEESDRAGFTKVAECLLGLAHDVLERPSRAH